VVCDGERGREEAELYHVLGSKYKIHLKKRALKL